MTNIQNVMQAVYDGESAQVVEAMMAADTCDVTSAQVEMVRAALTERDEVTP